MNLAAQTIAQRKDRMIMKTNLLHTVTLGALLTLAFAPPAFALDHGAQAAGAAAPSARPGVEIRKAAVSGYALVYNLTDMNTLMHASKMPMTSTGDTPMKSHHLRVYLVGPDGKAATDGKVGYLVIQPDKTDFKTLAVPIEGGFGADIDFVASGDYRITTKIVLGDTKLVDDFVYTVKRAGSGKVAVVNGTCPITGGALGQDGVVARLTRDYKGQKIGFCCDGCPESWDKLTDAEKNAALGKAKKPAK